MVVVEETEDSPKRGVIEVVLSFCQILTFLSPHKRNIEWRAIRVSDFNGEKTPATLFFDVQVLHLGGLLVASKLRMRIRREC
jgi:hypothetical protein